MVYSQISQDCGPIAELGDLANVLTLLVEKDLRVFWKPTDAI